MLARDPLGVKPLYFHHDSKRILFASRITSLFEDPSVPKKPCESMLGQFFVNEYLNHELTFFENIKQIAPAHLLIIDSKGRAQKKRYGSPDSVKLRRYKDKKQYHEEFFSLFETSVRNRLEGTAPGLLLSGGLDSLQVASMSEALRRKDAGIPALKSLCILVAGFLQEDVTNLERLRERYDPDIETVDRTGGPQDFFELYLEPGDTPRFDAYMTTPEFLEIFQAKGCKAILTGFGANEMSNLAEFGYLEDLLLTFRFKKFSEECGRFAQCLHNSRRDVEKMMLHETIREKTPWLCRRWMRQRRLQNRKWLRPEFRKKVSTQPPVRLRPFKTMAQNEPYHALFEPQITLALAEMSEATESFGLEARHPFFDLPLIEFFLSIPADILMEGGYRKNFIQHALAPVVPGPVKTADDERLYIPFPAEPGRTRDELARLQLYLSDRENLLYEYADPSEIQKILDPSNRSFDFPLLWRLVRLESWLRSFWGKPFTPRHPEAFFAEGSALPL